MCPPVEYDPQIGAPLTGMVEVGTEGTIDWYCCPRFDAPSLFGVILDRERGVEVEVDAFAQGQLVRVGGGWVGMLDPRRGTGVVGY